MPTTEDPPHAQTRLAAIAGASWWQISTSHECSCHTGG